MCHDRDHRAQTRISYLSETDIIAALQDPDPANPVAVEVAPSLPHSFGLTGPKAS
jgi:hypothetical protein